MSGVPDERGEDADRSLRTSFALYLKTGNAQRAVVRKCQIHKRHSYYSNPTVSSPYLHVGRQLCTCPRSAALYLRCEIVSFATSQSSNLSLPIRRLFHVF